MTTNQQQAEAWNGPEAAHFVEHATRYDRQLAPFADALFARAALASHHVVLDVGCGTGAVTIAAAAQVRAVLGVDISEPLVTVAVDRARVASADNVEFVVADAQTHPFPEGVYDLVLSHFGLMFFDDPIAAFTNLRRALTPDGRMVFVCWQGLADNEWVRLIADAVAQHAAVPELGGRAGGPGMFALKRQDEITAVLEAAGFTTVEVDSIAPSIILGGGGTLEDSTDFILGTGIARGLLGQVEPDARAAASEAVRAALADRYEPGVGVRLGTGAWLVTAGRR